MGLILNRDQQRRPFGGHHYPEMGQVLRGDSLEQLVSKVRELRIINGHPIGDPEKDVLRYYAEHFPYMVKTGDDAGQPIQPANYLKWRDWIRYMWFDPPKKLLTKTEAEIRWNMCKGCPHNVAKDWKAHEESDEFSRRAFMLRAGQPVAENLGFCDLHRWDISLAVFLPEPNKVSNPSNRVNKKDCPWAFTDEVSK